MRYFLISILLLFFAQANALEFLSKHPDSAKGTANFSSLTWYGDRHQGTILTVAPGKNDTVFLFGYGEYTIVIDKDLTFNTLVINSLTYAENKKINLKKLSSHISAAEGEINMLTMKNCTLKVSQEYTPTVLGGLQTIGIGRSVLKFIDSTGKINGLYTLNIVNTNIINTVPGGSTISLEGKSQVEFGGVLLDSFIKANPTKASSEFEFIEKNGNIPQLVFNSDVNDVAKSVIKLTITPTAKKGKYTLIEFTEKSSYAGEFSDIYINGKKVSFGESRQIAKLNVSIVKAASPTGKDKSTENDIVLIVEDFK